MLNQDKTVHQYDTINSEIANVYHEINRKLGLSDTESLILYEVAVNEDISQKKICSLYGLSKQTIHSAVKKMINAGIFEPLTGQKNEHLTLTKKGEGIIKDKISVFVDIENRVFQSWTTAERDMFIELSNRYLNSLKEECDKL